MVYQIIWTENAKADFFDIVSYLENEWSQRIAENFIIELYSVLDIIANSPLIGTPSEKLPSVRKMLVTKHNALYYMAEENSIILLDFFDTRQHPGKNLF